MGYTGHALDAEVGLVNAKGRLYDPCHGITVQTPPGGGDLGTAQAGSPSEEASAPAAPGVLEKIEASPGVRGTAQAWGGFFVGLGLGLTPGGAMTDTFLSTARAMDRGTRPAQVGKALGEMLGGFYLTASGVTGEIVGTGLTTTGIGSVLGVPAMVVSAGLVTSGAANMAAGLRGLSDALMSSGSGGGKQAAGGGPKFPGTDPTQAPEGFEWRGKPGSAAGSKDGNFYNPKTGESLRPDLSHPDPIGPHWDYRDPGGNWWRIKPDGTMEAK